MMAWWLAVLIALDQLFNAILWGYPDETLSSRAYRSCKIRVPPKKRWVIIYHLINGIFFDRDHCRNSYISERDQKQNFGPNQPEVSTGPAGAKPQV